MTRRRLAIALGALVILALAGIAMWLVTTAAPHHVWVRNTLRVNRDVGVPHVVANPDGADAFKLDWHPAWVAVRDDAQVRTGEWHVTITRRRRGIEQRIAKLLRLSTRVETYAESGPQREEGPYTWTRYERR